MQCQCHNSWSLHCFTFITLTFTFFDQCAASDLGHLFSVMMTSLRFETFETETLWLCLDVSVPGSSSLCECKDGSTEAACNTVLEEDRKGGDVQALHTHTRCSRWSRVQSVLFCDVLRALGDRVAYSSSWIEITMSQCHCCNMLQTKMMVHSCYAQCSQAGRRCTSSSEIKFLGLNSMWIPWLEHKNRRGCSMFQPPLWKPMTLLDFSFLTS